MGRITPDGLEPRPGPGLRSVKTASSLPDAIFRDAERLGRRLKKY